jgi:hypothetical protein
MITMSAQIEAEYLNSYEVSGDALYLRIYLRTKLTASTSQSPRFIVIPKLHYDVYLHECGIETSSSCRQVSQNSIYHGEVNWLEISCPSSSCDQEVKLPINLNKELISRLVSIVKDNKRPAFQVVLSTDPYAIAIPYVVARPPLLSANVVTVLDLNMVNASIKSNLGNYIVLSSDDVKHILNNIKYFERVKIEVEVKLPETTEGLPKPLIDAIKALEKAFEDIKNLDFASAIIRCRSAIELITTREKRSDNYVKVIRNEVKKTILSRYKGAAENAYTEVLNTLDETIRDIYTMMSNFVHLDSNEIEFNPRMADAIYICRQTLGIIDYLVELSRA